MPDTSDPVSSRTRSQRSLGKRGPAPQASRAGNRMRDRHRKEGTTTLAGTRASSQGGDEVMVTHGSSAADSISGSVGTPRTSYSLEAENKHSVDRVRQIGLDQNAERRSRQRPVTVRDAEGTELDSDLGSIVTIEQEGKSMDSKVSVDSAMRVEQKTRVRDVRGGRVVDSKVMDDSGIIGLAIERSLRDRGGSGVSGLAVGDTNSPTADR